MQPDDRDAARLWDMLDAARTPRDFTTGVRFHDYLQDRKLQLALERAVEIIGEAARGVSDAFRQAHPEIPWRPIIGQRHVLAHEYAAVRPERIWLVVTTRLPELIAALER